MTANWNQICEGCCGGARPAHLQDDAEKRIQSLPQSAAKIEARQSGVALFPEEEPACIVPPGTADNSPPFQPRKSSSPQRHRGTELILHAIEPDYPISLQVNHILDIVHWFLCVSVPLWFMNCCFRFNGGTSNGPLSPPSPGGTAENSPPFQRWDKQRSIIPPSPGGTAETLSVRHFSRPSGTGHGKRGAFSQH